MAACKDVWDASKALTQLAHVLLQRIVRMGGPVDDDMANLIVAQLLYLDSVDQERDITMYVNSPGGSVTAGENHVQQHSGPSHVSSNSRQYDAALQLVLPLTVQAEWLLQVTPARVDSTVPGAAETRSKVDCWTSTMPPTVWSVWKPTASYMSSSCGLHCHVEVSCYNLSLLFRYGCI